MLPGLFCLVLIARQWHLLAGGGLVVCSATFAAPSPPVLPVSSLIPMIGKRERLAIRECKSGPKCEEPCDDAPLFVFSFFHPIPTIIICPPLLLPLSSFGVCHLLSNVIDSLTCFRHHPMVSVWRQLRLLLWKGMMIKKRQKVEEKSV
jgi:hypothetical protein